MPSPRFALWKGRFDRLGLGAGATAINALGGVIRNKWFAHQLETAGLGVLAQVLSGQVWLGTATGAGLGLPVARAVGAALAANDLPAVRRTVWTALSVLAVSGTGVTALGLVFAPQISAVLLDSPAYAPLVRISMVGVWGVAAQGVLSGLFAGHSDLRAPFTFALLGNGAATLAVLLLVPRMGLAGAVLGMACFYPVALIGTLRRHGRLYAPALTPVPRPRFDPALGARLLKVAAAALALALLDQGTMLAMRAHYLRAQGVDANGLLQAALALTQQVGAVFYVYLGSYAFGRISGAPGPEGIRDYTRRQWLPLVLVAALAFACAMLAAGPLLRLLYSQRFEGARPMMAWAMLGEFAKVCMQVWALGALPLGGVRLWFPLGAAYVAGLATCYAGATALGFGLLSLPLGYAGGGLVALAAVAVVMSRRGVGLGARDGAITLTALAGLALLAGAIAGWPRPGN